MQSFINTKFSFSKLPAAVALVALTLSLSTGAATCAEVTTAKDASGDKVEFCSVKCNDPHPACSESAKVIDTLNQLTQLINDGDFKGMAEYFDDGVTTFNEDNKRLIIGKEAVLADLKERYSANKKLDGKLISYTIDRPYAEVNGNRAVVTFVAKKVLANNRGIEHAVEMESHSTEVFVKEDGKWKTLHYRGAWKKLS
jgi:hypothetical protein